MGAENLFPSPRPIEIQCPDRPARSESLYRLPYPCPSHMYEVFNSFFPPVAPRPNAGHGLLILEVSRSHTTTHHNRLDSSGRVISASQRPLPDNTQHSQQTDIHAPGGIRTHNLSRRAAVDLRLRPRGHRDRQLIN